MSTPTFPYKGWTLDPKALAAALQNPTISLWKIEQRAEDNARKYHHEITVLGGRPSRDVREESLWETELIDDDYFEVYDAETGDQSEIPIEKFWRRHWLKEWTFFKGERDLWAKFLRREERIGEDYLTPNELENMRSRSRNEKLGNIVFALRQWRGFWRFQQDQVSQFEEDLDNLEPRMKRWTRPRQCKSALTFPNPTFETVYENHRRPARQLEIARVRLAWIRNESKQIAREAFDLLTPRGRELLLETLNRDLLVLQNSVQQLYGVTVGDLISPNTVIVEDLMAQEEQILQLMHFTRDCSIAKDCTIAWQDLKKRYALATKQQLDQLAIWEKLERSEAGRQEALGQWSTFWQIAEQYFASKSTALANTGDEVVLDTTDTHLRQCHRQQSLYHQLISASNQQTRSIQSACHDLRTSVQSRPN